jgi:membrane-bound lytic murein transglycosylase D
MEAQKKNSFYQLRLNNETAKYVYKIVAVKELFNQPERSNTWLDDKFLASLSEYHLSLAKTKDLLPKTAPVALKVN